MVDEGFTGGKSKKNQSEQHRKKGKKRRGARVLEGGRQFERNES